MWSSKQIPVGSWCARGFGFFGLNMTIPHSRALRPHFVPPLSGGVVQIPVVVFLLFVGFIRLRERTIALHNDEIVE